MIKALMNTEKKPHVNGYASPSHLSSNISNQAAKQSKCASFAKKMSYFPLRSILFLLIYPCCDIFNSVVEGYLRTDDRMRLAKERREERERSLGKKHIFSYSCKLKAFGVISSSRPFELTTSVMLENMSIHKIRCHLIWLFWMTRFLACRKL